MSYTKRSGGERPAPDPETTVEALHAKLQQAVEAIETGEQWQAWLDFAGRFHSYSFSNTVLIHLQMPSATRVAGYRTWKSVGRQVRRGEKAIRIMAPILRREKVLDDNGQPRRDAEGKYVVRKQVAGYRSASVFDIAATDGDPIVEPVRAELLNGAAPAGLWDRLVGEITERGYRLLRGPVDQLDGANGLTKVAEREVWIRDDVDDLHACKTALHELAHVLMHCGDADSLPECRGIAEVEAESVAHLVLGAMGVESGAYTFPYVASWAYPVAAVDHVPMADIIARTGQRVMKTANEILAATTPAEPAPVAAAEPLAVLAERTHRLGDATDQLRDRSQAKALPVVDEDTLRWVLADTQDFYHRQMSGSWVPAYLADRQLDRAIGSHGVGHAPPGWTTLTDYLRTLGYGDDHIEAAGVATRTRTGRLIDRMRDRMTIPLHDEHGRLVGFTARCAPDTTDERVPKYLNTPTTTLYRKSEVLYGLGEHAVAGDLRPGSAVMVCEGPLDAIAVDLAAVESGIPVYGVAACGTAFTAQHARQLRALGPDVSLLLAYDADPAGVKATDQTWMTLTDDGPVDARVALLPAGDDPASLHATGSLHPARLIAEAPSAGIVVGKSRVDGVDMAGHVGRELAAYRDLSKLAERMPEEVQATYLICLASQLRIHPADAAAIVADTTPTLFMDQVVKNCEARVRALDGDETTASGLEWDGDRATVAVTTSHTRQ